MVMIPTKAYHVPVDGRIVEIFPENGKTFELEEVQSKVDGYIEVIRLTDEQIMIVDEEGKFRKEYNALATGIADIHHALRAGDYICGDIVICPSAMLP